MKKTVIKFWASWCGPCSVYAPAFESVKQELQSEEIQFVEVNVENDPDNLAGEYGVRGIPHTVVIQEGADTKAKSGRIDEQELREFILN
jgi:thioredoxin-like negative regulator of GroEL